jgi:hypothetical protein
MKSDRGATTQPASIGQSRRFGTGIGKTRRQRHSPLQAGYIGSEVGYARCLSGGQCVHEAIGYSLLVGFAAMEARHRRGDPGLLRAPVSLAALGRS